MEKWQALWSSRAPRKDKPQMWTWCLVPKADWFSKATKVTPTLINNQMGCCGRHLLICLLHVHVSIRNGPWMNSRSSLGWMSPRFFWIAMYVCVTYLGKWWPEDKTMFCWEALSLGSYMDISLTQATDLNIPRHITSHLHWPPNSLVLNLIEHLWGVLDKLI